MALGAGVKSPEPGVGTRDRAVGVGTCDGAADGAGFSGVPESQWLLSIRWRCSRV